MIFIVIGIVILFASFTIAFISLVREQRLNQPIERDLGVDASEQKVVSERKVSSTFQQPKNDELLKSEESEKIESSEREPFFWEIDQEILSGQPEVLLVVEPADDSNRLQEEQVSQSDIDGAIDSYQIDLENRDMPKDRLSGQFFIKDITYVE